MSTDFGTVVTKTKIESGWANAIIDHAFEKEADILVRRKAVGSWEALYGFGSDQAGKILQSADGPVEAIQAAHDELTGGGKIYVKPGAYAKEWEDKLNITTDSIEICSVLGYTTGNFGTVNKNYFQAIDGLNKDMLWISGKNSNVHDLCLDGNKAGQSSGKGIVVNPASEHAILKNINILKTKQEGLVDDGVETDYDLINIESCDYYGWRLTNAYGAAARRVNSYLHTYSAIKMDAASARCKMIQCFGDSSGGNGFSIDGKLHIFLACKAGLNWNNGFNLYGVQDSEFDIFSYDNGQGATNTYDNVHLGDNAVATHCLRNSIKAHCHNDQTNKCAYDIHEVDANQDYNTVVSGTVCKGAATAAVLLAGAHSKKTSDIQEV